MDNHKQICENMESAIMKIFTNTLFLYSKKLISFTKRIKKNLLAFLLQTPMFSLDFHKKISMMYIYACVMYNQKGNSPSMKRDGENYSLFN